MSWPFHILHLMTKFDFMGIQNLPCEQRFLSRMAFKVNQVIHVPYQFCGWPVLHTGCKQTNYVTDKPSGQLCKRYKSCKRKTSAPSEVYKIKVICWNPLQTAWSLFSLLKKVWTMIFHPLNNIPVLCQTFHMMHNEILYQTDGYWIIVPNLPSGLNLPDNNNLSKHWQLITL